MATKKQEQNSIIKELEKKVAALPSKPGVYMYKDDQDEVIYVGKAVRLRSRVRSYFRNDPKASAKTKILVKKIADLEYIMCSNELEALLLENNLIKKYRPKYNIRLRDDKNYLYVKITNEDFPQVLFVRRMQKDGAKYFGPYTSATAIRDAMRLVEKVFAYRKCAHEFFQVPEGNPLSPPLTKGEKQKIRNPKGIRRCVQYQMGRCIGVCQPEVSKQEHDEIIEMVVKFFDGRADEIVKDLQQLMSLAAMNQDYEQAARLRDQIQEIETILEKQQAVSTDQADRDVLGFATLKSKACVQLFKVRKGILIGREEFTLDCATDCDEQEVIRRVLTDYYERANEIPREILLPIELEDKSTLAVWISELKAKSLRLKTGVELLVPQRGEKKHLLDLVSENAKQRLDELLGEWMTKDQRRTAALNEIKDALQLARKPERIECYDISHLGGEGTVGSMVVLVNGEIKKGDYRKFKIKTTGGGDDYEALREVLRRRLARIQNAKFKMQNYRLRQPTVKEMKQIEEIIKQEKLDGHDLAREQFVALKEGKKIIGFGRVKRYQIPDASSQKIPLNPPLENKGKGEEVYEAASLWVDPDFRGRQLGYVILAELIKRCPGKVIYGATYPYLAEYYEGFGFKRIKTGPKVIFDKVACGCTQKVCEAPVVLRYDKVLHTKDDLSFKAVPDLVLIDGGKGQLGAITGVMHERGFIKKVGENVQMSNTKVQGSKRKAKSKAGVKGSKQKAKNTPWDGFAFAVASIAKENEELFVPWQEEAVELARDSQGSLLLQRIRDEAHRFAITYQKKVRSKELFNL